MQFSAAARRRSRRRQLRRRVAVAAWALSALGALVGLPITAHLDPFERLAGEGRPRAADFVPVTSADSVASATRFRREVFTARPKPPRPTPSPPQPTESPAPAATTPEPAYGGSITDIVFAAAAEFGVDGGYLLSVASCESGLDPGAVNAAGYHGLFQFDEQTWAAYGYGSIYDPVAQARTAARLLAAGQSSRWPNCA